MTLQNVFKTLSISYELTTQNTSQPSTPNQGTDLNESTEFSEVTTPVKKGKGSKKMKFVTKETSVKLSFSNSEMKSFVIQSWSLKDTFGVFTPIEVIISIASKELPTKNYEFNYENTMAFIASYKLAERKERNTVLTTSIKKKLKDNGVSFGVPFSTSMDTGSVIDKVVKSMAVGYEKKKELSKTYEEWTKEVVCLYTLKLKYSV